MAEELEIPEDVIIPPPAIKEIILKTASYVHRNGKEFETKIRENESNNNKFTFVNENDPYHGYYTFVLEHIESFTVGNGNSGGDKEEEDGVDKVELEEPKELEFIVDLPPITAKDLEIIKLTALFVASNGENYIAQVRNKYKDQTAQFSFLNDGHSFHQLFLRYLTQYRKLINESEEDLNLDHDVLEESYKRAKWNQANKMNDIKRKEELEARRLKFASVNWQDFTIVETINITEIDSHTEFPLPLTVTDLQYRSLEQKSEELSIPSVTPMAEPTASELQVANNNGMKIRAYGETRLKRTQQGNLVSASTGEKLIECPITGKMIPENGFEKHIQILLRDPKYKQEKLNYESKIKNSNLSTTEVVDNIKNLFRPAKDKNGGPGTKRQKVQWDGYQSSVTFVQEQNKNDGLNDEELKELKRKRTEELNKIGPSRS